MLYWAIRACKESKYIDAVYVSTEDEEIASISLDLGALVIRRPQELAQATVFKQDVIVHAAEQIGEEFGLVVSVQPNSPEIQSEDIDSAIVKLVEHHLNEVFSVGKDLVQNAAFRVMKSEYVFQKSLSTHCGVVVTDYIDIHTAEDLELVQHRQLNQMRASHV